MRERSSRSQFVPGVCKTPDGEGRSHSTCVGDLSLWVWRLGHTVWRQDYQERTEDRPGTQETLADTHAPHHDTHLLLHIISLSHIDLTLTLLFPAMLSPLSPQYRAHQPVAPTLICTARRQRLSMLNQRRPPHRQR
jgi:hypothetical protein